MTISKIHCLLLSIIIVILLFHNQSFGQKKNKIYLEPIGRMEANILINKNDFNSDFVNPKPAINFSYGLGGQYYFKDNFGIALQFLFDREGSNYSGKNSYFSYTASSDLRYYKIPLSLQFASKEKGGGLKISYQIGLYYAILHSFQETYTSPMLTVNWNQDGVEYEYYNQPPFEGSYKDERPYKKGDVGLFFGTGLTKKATDALYLSMNIFIEAGLMDIENKKSYVNTLWPFGGFIWGDSRGDPINQGAKYPKVPSGDHYTFNRSPTHTFSTGIKVGFIYKIN